MSETLSMLLYQVRNHPGLKEFIETLRPHPMPRFRGKAGDTLAEYGAKSSYSSGRLDQFEAMERLLTGQASQETNSNKERL